MEASAIIEIIPYVYSMRLFHNKCTGFCCVLFSFSCIGLIGLSDVSISFKVVTLARGQSYKPTLKDLAKIGRYQTTRYNNKPQHDDVIKWKHFPRCWPFVRGIHRLPVNSQHKGQWRGALMFSLICTRLNGWVNNPEAGDLRRHSAHYDVMWWTAFIELGMYCAFSKDT